MKAAKVLVLALLMALVCVVSSQGPGPGGRKTGAHEQGHAANGNGKANGSGDPTTDAGGVGPASNFVEVQQSGQGQQPSGSDFWITVFTGVVAIAGVVQARAMIVNNRKMERLAVLTNDTLTEVKKQAASARRAARVAALAARDNRKAIGINRDIAIATKQSAEAATQAAEGTVKAAKVAEEDMMLGKRAFIQIYLQHASTMGPGNIKATFHYKNIGSTPAIVIEIAHLVFVGPTKPAYVIPGIHDTHLIIMPGDDVTRQGEWPQFFPGTMPIRGQDPDNEWTRDMVRSSFLARVVYLDMFGKQHETVFGMITEKGRLVYIDDPRYNKAT